MHVHRLRASTPDNQYDENSQSTADLRGCRYDQIHRDLQPFRELAAREGRAALATALAKAEQVRPISEVKASSPAN